jgi:hypothetical protein
VLSVQAQPYSSTAWTQVGVATTSTTGAFGAVVRPSVNTRYRVGYAGSGAIGGAYSAVRLVAVAPAMSIRPNRTSLGLGGTVTFSTTVAPLHAGGPVLLQRWTGASWATVAVRTLSRVSTASATVRPPRRGIDAYRWATPADRAHAVGYSASWPVRVY